MTYLIGRGIARLFQATTFAEYGGEKTQRLHTLASVFRRARIPSVTAADMEMNANRKRLDGTVRIQREFDRRNQG